VLLNKDVALTDQRCGSSDFIRHQCVEAAQGNPAITLLKLMVAVIYLKGIEVYVLPLNLSFPLLKLLACNHINKLPGFPLQFIIPYIEPPLLLIVAFLSLKKCVEKNVIL